MARERKAAEFPRENGVEWKNGVRGNGLCIPLDSEKQKGQKLVLQVQKVLTEKGLTGIEYVNQEPQFEVVAEGTVDIPHMSRFRTEGQARREIEDNYKTGKSHYSYESLEKLLTHEELVSNYTQADYLLAAQWTKEEKDGHAWTPADIKNYREKRKLTWHERMDGHNMDLVPTCINDYFKHLGGVSRTKNVREIAGIEQEKLGEYDDGRYAGSVSTSPKGNKSSRKNNSGFCQMQMLITGFLVILAITMIAICGDGYGGLLTLIPAVIAPFFILLGLLNVFKRLSKSLKTKIGGFILLGALVVLFVLIPLFRIIFSIALFLLVGFVIYKIVMELAPNGYITIRRTDAVGNTTEEYRAVYGSMQAEMMAVEQELRDEGYTNIRKE